jgi:hypothetical protein
LEHTEESRLLCGLKFIEKLSVGIVEFLSAATPLADEPALKKALVSLESLEVGNDILNLGLAFESKSVWEGWK